MSKILTMPDEIKLTILNYVQTPNKDRFDKQFRADIPLGRMYLSLKHKESIKENLLNFSLTCEDFARIVAKKRFGHINNDIMQSHLEISEDHWSRVTQASADKIQ